MTSMRKMTGATLAATAAAMLMGGAVTLTSAPASAAPPSRRGLPCRCGGAGPGPAAAPEPGPTRIRSRKSTAVSPATPASRNRLGTLAFRITPSSDPPASVTRSQTPTPNACSG